MTVAVGPLLMTPGALEGVPGDLCSLEVKGGPFPQDVHKFLLSRGWVLPAVHCAVLSIGAL